MEHFFSYNLITKIINKKSFKSVAICNWKFFKIMESILENNVYVTASFKCGFKTINYQKKCLFYKNTVKENNGFFALFTVYTNI